MSIVKCARAQTQKETEFILRSMNAIEHMQNAIERSRAEIEQDTSTSREREDDAQRTAPADYTKPEGHTDPLELLPKSEIL